jgi:putative ABC transport system permease protein
MRKLPRGIRRVFRVNRKLKSQAADDVDSEILFHLQSRVEDLMQQGWERNAAERRALEEFGDVKRAKPVLLRESRRTESRARLAEWAHGIAQDVRYGWRTLWARPGFALVAIVTLALGIGANSAIFSVVHAVLLRPLPYPDAERLVQIWEITPDGDDHNVVSRGNFMDWRDLAQSFEELGAHSSGYGVGLTPRDGDPIRITGASATPGVFRTLRVSPQLGRTFAEDEGEPGGGAVVLISDRLWRQRFSSDPAVVGTTAIIDEQPATIVGVMHPEFDFPDPTVDVWWPWSLDESDRQSRRSHNMMVIGRLRAGVTEGQAQAEMHALALRIAEQHPQYMTGWGVNVMPFRADMVSRVRPMLLLLLGVVVVVLLIACANLANLLLARALAREREVAVRCALGAGRGRLVRQLITEAGLIALIGGGLGFAVTAWGLDLFVALAPSDIPLIDGVRVDLTVLGFAFGATVLATLLFGLVPALRVTGVDPQAALRAGDERAGGAPHLRLRAGLLVAEVALSVLLLIGAGLLLRSFQQLQRVDYGFDPSQLHTTNLVLPGARYDETPRQVTFLTSLIERVAAIPGVVVAAGTSDGPGGSGPMTFSFAIEDQPNPGPTGREDPVPLRVVTPDFFLTMRLPVLQGRALDERDGADAPPVLVINESLARRHWPDDDPVGQRISFQREGIPEWWEVVGVVADTRLYSVDEPATPALYMPYAQKRWDWINWMFLLVRSPRQTGALSDELRAAIHDADAALPIGQIQTVEDRYAQGEARRRFAAALLVAFAAVALIIGVVGIYGVLSYSVAQRTREIGVRMALGAPRSSVAAAVVGQGVGLAGAGVIVGVAGAWLLSRFAESLVYGVSTRDTVTFVAVPVVLTLVAAVSSYVPARRATRIDPVRALRAE